MSKKQKADFYREYDLIECRNYASKKPPAAHQEEAIIKLKKWFEANEFPSGSILALPTGSGKTFTAVRFLCKNVIAKGYKILWLAHTHHLLEQAFYSFGPLSEEFNEGYEVGWIPEPKEQLNIRVVSGTHNHFNINQIKATDDVLIATLQSIVNAHKKKHSKLEKFLKSTKGKIFLVFDEAHHAPAPSYRNLIIGLRKRFKKMNLLGLTATPTHMNLEKRGWLVELFPQKIVHQTSIEKLFAADILAKPIIKVADTNIIPEFDEREYLAWDDEIRDLPTRVVTKLAENKKRNKLIAAKYIENKNIYGKTIIFADRGFQCDDINNHLIEQGISSDVMYFQMGNERNANVLERFKNNELDVIVNIKMLTEGTDVPDLSTVFISRQTTSTILMTQMVGRALRGRRFGGGKDANLVFFHDDWHKTINWAFWNADTWEAEKTGDPEARGGRGKGPTDVSHEHIRRIFDMMDSGTNINPGPFLIFMPIGWFKVNKAEINEEGNPERVERLVMVYENEYDHYLNLIQHLKNENLAIFDDEMVQLEEQKDIIKNWYVDFFGESEYVGDISPNIFNITCHLAQNMGQPPRFIEFKARKDHDLESIAEQYIEADYGPTTVREKLIKEYKRDDRYWKVIYYNFELFKFQYNAIVEWTLDQDGTYHEPIRNKENKLIELLEKGNTKQRIQACEELGDMGLEETIHEETIELIEKIALTDDDTRVKEAALCVVNLINTLTLSPDEKNKIKKRDNYRCLCCGEAKKRFLEVDHIKPRYFEVDNSEDNLQTLCKLCNITKSTDTIDFRQIKTPLTEPPSEFPSLEKIDTLDKWSVRDLNWWTKWIKRNINFYYQSRAVKSIKFEDNTWTVLLNSGNEQSWLNTHLKELTESIRSIRNKYGYSGPDEILLFKKDPRECKNLIKILKTGNDREQKKAATKAGKLGCKSAVTPLIKFTKRSDSFATPAAATALGRIGDKRAVKPLIQMIGRENNNFPIAASNALINIGKPAVKDLIIGLSRKNVHVRRFSAEALGQIGDKRAISGLIDVLNDEESIVRWRAARALGRIGDVEASEALKKVLEEDTDKKTKEEAEIALKKMRDSINTLFESFTNQIKKIDDNIHINKIKHGYSYYTPKRVFLYSWPGYYYKIGFWLYTNNEPFENVVKHPSKPDWGTLYLEREEDLPKTMEIIKRSFELKKSSE
ncbi:MAG: HEAT repeat domain-containing protein [Methanobacterium sp.]|uniref:HEAT repeat domain-containing protein n=1 Tax=Methanobacterium sp. MZD130B TaxID=3394378 RepID=UPI0039FD4983